MHLIYLKNNPINKMIRRFISTGSGKIITFVKKVDSTGKSCTKCAQVIDMMEKNDLMKHITKIENIVENDTNSVGSLLASKYKIKNAPFFIVNYGKETRVYPYYTQFLKNEIHTEVSEKDKIKDIFDKNFSNDYL